ncbi:hypothetical protein CAC42_1337 [Sphaceloma murrayae]|uniref:Uncharacterized protein n=1 Tax=Sphaceloma murrayae TaxID=2082308 RepID=A0A2K1QFI3_9PEZI|nr:hypothetical protein CAC42_1337 [Sphaceloma murrayae]
MLSRLKIALCILLLTLLLTALHLLTNQLSFESYLHSRLITLSSFSPSYVNALLSAPDPRSDFNFTFPNTTHPIPRKIHFIWFRDLYPDTSRPSHIPSSGSHAPARCLLFNPHFTHQIWNATSARDLLSTHYPWFLPVYDAYPHPIQRVDAFKYFLLYHHGGVYLDMDVACRRNLDPLLDFGAWWPKARPWGVNNDVMAATKGHPLLRRMMERLQARNRRWGSTWWTVWWSTGPGFAGDMLGEWWREGRGMDEGDAEIRVLPEAFYSEQYTFFGHSPGGTWYGSDVMVITWIVDRVWIFLSLFAVLGMGYAFFVWRRSTRSGRRMSLIKSWV